MNAKYRKGYKYQLADHLIFDTDFRVKDSIITPRVELSKGGRLLIREGYASDGVSGPVVDRKTNLRGGFIHDALYQLMRMGFLDHRLWREADKEFAKALKQDGAWRLTVKIDMAGLKLAKGRAAHPKKRKRVFTAP